MRMYMCACVRVCVSNPTWVSQISLRGFHCLLAVYRPPNPQHSPPGVPPPTGPQSDLILSLLPEAGLAGSKRIPAFAVWDQNRVREPVGGDAGARAATRGRQRK